MNREENIGGNIPLDGSSIKCTAKEGQRKDINVLPRSLERERENEHVRIEQCVGVWVWVYVLDVWVRVVRQDAVKTLHVHTLPPGTVASS